MKLLETQIFAASTEPHAHSSKLSRDFKQFSPKAEKMMKFKIFISSDFTNKYKMLYRITYLRNKNIKVEPLKRNAVIPAID